MVISEKYKEYLVEHYPTDLSLNERARYDFKNGYGASVIHGRTSYGLEVAVLEYKGDEWDITYDTPLTDDVIGYIEDLDTVLDDIYELGG